MIGTKPLVGPVAHYDSGRMANLKRDCLRVPPMEQLDAMKRLLERIDAMARKARR